MAGIYRWKEGSRFSADAEKVAEELQGLPEQTPHAALVFAEDPATELHKCATWDDAKAAHMFRLDEMRRVIRSVVIIDESPERDPIQYRAFEYVTPQDAEEPKQQFMNTKSALQNPEFRGQIIAEIKASIQELRHKVKTYQYVAEEMAEVQHHLDMAIKAAEVTQ